ncbi:vegetative cell wall protein gp1-like [Miscanthus floridulus]|uniref:vegetative cell wall protein gp1-like n=1 Tax=Miscanthus floridulus TaxID=154761 RepID=UPI00345A20E1
MSPRPPYPADVPPPLHHPRMAARPSQRAPTTFAAGPPTPVRLRRPPRTPWPTGARRPTLAAPTPRPAPGPRQRRPSPLGMTLAILDAPPTAAAILSLSPARLGRPQRPPSPRHHSEEPS